MQLQKLEALRNLKPDHGMLYTGNYKIIHWKHQVGTRKLVHSTNDIIVIYNNY